MRVFVTGANGHIGTNLLPRLLAAGHAVVAFVRPTSNTASIDGLDIDFARGDVRDPDALREGASGCDAIIHLAALYTLTGGLSEILPSAMEGAQNIIQAATSNQIKRLVYTSSSLSVGTAQKADRLDESNWADGARVPYAIAKRESERMVTRLASEAGVEVIVLNPVAIIGPGDHRLTPSTRLVRDMLEGNPTVPGGLSFVDVRDVADVHAAALEAGIPGERYLLCGWNQTQRELGTDLYSLTGRRPTHLPIPRFMALPMMALVAGLSHLVGATPPMTTAQARDMWGRWLWYDGSKATRTFGFEYRDPRRTLTDTVQWLIDHGELSSSLRLGAG